MLPTVFDCCTPREDVLSGSLGDYAAELRTVIFAQDSVAEAAAFFENTYPTIGLKRLLEAVGRRLSRHGDAEGSTLRLDSTFGGGKTHGMIALVHLARTPEAVPTSFLNTEYRPSRPSRVAAFDGEMANVSTGIELESGLFAKTPWGYLAYRLGGRAAFERIRANDVDCSAPGSEDWLRIIGDQPTLILIDEIGEWLRKLRNREDRRQLAPFLKALISAVDLCPDAALVLSLAIGKGGKSTDAFTQENEAVAAALAEAESVGARKLVILNPTAENETAGVLRQRLFQWIDPQRVLPVIDAYGIVWENQRAHLPDDKHGFERKDSLLRSYPFHPDLIATLNAKTATFQNFQRVRGMLRILTLAIRRLWEIRPSDASAIHTHHLDLGVPAIRVEFTTKLDQQSYDSAISYDIANADPLQPARAQRIDETAFPHSPPFASYVARTIFVNSLAVNAELRGLTPEELRAAMLAPGFPGGLNDGGAAFIEDARKRFVDVSGYLDDRTSTSLRFAAEANLNRIIEQTKVTLDRSTVRKHLETEIRKIFAAPTKGAASFELLPFPASPADIPDDANDGKPYLALISYDAVHVDGEVTETPEFLARLAKFKGSDGTSIRRNRNNLVFVVADSRQIDEMQDAMRRKLAIDDINARQASALSEHQAVKLRAMGQSETQRVAITIAQCYRHLFYPAVSAIDDAGLAHLAMQRDATAAEPGIGQRSIIRTLAEYGKTVSPGDPPPNPEPTLGRTPLWNSGSISTGELREEFRRNRRLPMLFGDDPFIALIKAAVQADLVVYKRGELIFADHQPATTIEVSENAMIFTVAHAREQGIWPKAEASTATRESEGYVSALPEPRSATPGVGQPYSPTLFGNSTAVADRPAIFEETAPLAEAFAKIRERIEGVEAELLTLTILSTALHDGRGLVIGAQSLREYETWVELEITDETTSGSSLEIKFGGTAADARALLDGLGTQLGGSENLAFMCSLTVTAKSRWQGTQLERLGAMLAKTSPGEVSVTAVP